MKAALIGLFLGLLFLGLGFALRSRSQGWLTTVTPQHWYGNWNCARGEVRIEPNGSKLRVVGPELNRSGDFVSISQGARIWQESGGGDEVKVPRALEWKAGQQQPVLRMDDGSSGLVELKLEKKR